MKQDQMQNHTFTRREFLKLSALAGTTTAFLSGCEKFHIIQNTLEKIGEDNAYPLAEPEQQILSVCQQCNTQCGIKVKLWNGVAVKIEGNPYSPWNLAPHIDYNTPLIESANLDAPICPKGQAGLQTVYDGYRLTQVLKRAGKRGENRWEVIPFEQAIEEIVKGGKLFAHVAGEEDRQVEGLESLYAIRDPKLMKAMDGAVKKIWAEKDPAKKLALVDQFKEDFKDHLDKMIDPDHPDLGPKNNQILYFWGRKKAGRAEFAHRFFGSGLGTVNRHGHTTVCQGSLYFAGKAMSEQWDSNTGKFSGGAKAYWQGDTASARFVIFVGASPFEGNYGPTNRVPRITQRYAEGELKFVVIDPRLSKIAAKAWKWLPNKPGTEGAIAMALIQWIIAHERYDANYLANANKKAAKDRGEPTWCNASWLVKIENGKPGKFLRGSDLKLVQKVEEEKDGKTVINWKTEDGTTFVTDPFVILDENDQPILFDPNDDERAAVAGKLFVDTKIQDYEVKSSLQLLKESAAMHTLDEWAEISGVSADDLALIAHEYTSYGKNAAVDIHRGVSQHTNGFYNVIAWNTLALLIGSYDWQGGQVYASTYDITGAKAEGPFNLSKSDPLNLAPFGISIIRHDVKYEDTTLFASLPENERYPAKRNWYPLASDIYEEIIPSAGDQYPYPIKAVFIYMGSPVYSLPGGHTWIEILRDVDKIPLFVASDITIGETSMYADYIFPDVTFLERWEFSGSHPSLTFKVQGVRQPVIAPLSGTVKVYGEEMALQFEAMLLGLAEKLGLPKFGKGGIGDYGDFTHPDDFYLRLTMNLAYGEKPQGEDAVADASDEEERVFLEARKHLPKAVFDVERWKRITGNAWRKVVTVLNRGGRFQAYEKGYPNPTGSKAVPTQVGNKYGKLLNMYMEKTAGVKHSGTGKSLPGIATFIEPYMGYDGKIIEDNAQGYDLKLITYREISQTKSRTPGNYWLRALLPHNFLLINSKDAAARNILDGDTVQIFSATNPTGELVINDTQRIPILAKVKITEGMKPGVVGFALGFGHWAYGSHDITINKTTIPGEASRMEGFHANAVMRLDPLVKHTCLFDPVGGSAVFYDTMVKIVKA